MNYKRLTPIALIAVAALLTTAIGAPLIGAGVNQDQTRSRDDDYRHVTETESKSFPVNFMPLVRLETFDGTITVRSWDKAEVTINAIKRARTGESLRAIRLQIDQSGAEVFAKAEFDRYAVSQTREWGNVRFEVFVPRESNLRAFTGDGSVTVEGVAGNVELKTGDGSMTVEGVAGEMELKTGDGSIRVNQSRGRLRASTGDGRIEVIRFDGEADARTNDGRITLDGRFTGLTARTGDGSISLSVPDDLNATLETSSESVSVQGLNAMEETDPSSRSRRWRLGSGGNLISLTTGDGRITVRRGAQ